jgi:NAD(P)-dependent dehydrogenase (short-subunit alcohol dehydrogenase family)
LRGKTAVVTGANSGVGKAAASALASLGAHVVLACRDKGRGEVAMMEIERSSPPVAPSLVQLDLGDLRSVERFADELAEVAPRLDILVNNAGSMVLERCETEQGFERMFGANYLAHYALTRLVLDRLREGGEARVINVSSNGHRFVDGIQWDDLDFTGRWTPTKAYAQSKFAQILFTRELSRRYGGAGLFAFAIHPGFVDSPFYAANGEPTLSGRLAKVAVSLFGVSPDAAAEGVIDAATGTFPTELNGAYWHKMKPRKPSRAALDEAAGARLWEISEALLAKAGTALPPA